MYESTILNPLKSLDIFFWKILGLLQNPMVSFWYLYLSHDNMIAQSCLDPGDNSICQFTTYQSNGEICIKLFSFSIIYCIFQGRKWFPTNYLFFLTYNSLTFQLCFYWIKVEGPHSVIFNFVSTTGCKILSNSFLNMALCSFGTGYGLSFYGLATGFSSIATGLILQVDCFLFF